MRRLPADAAVRQCLGARIRQLRLQQGLTQDDLAGQLDMALKALQRLESGQHNPTLDTMAHVARGLRVSVGALLSDAAETHALAPLLAKGWRPAGQGQQRRAIAVMDIHAVAGLVPLHAEGQVATRLQPPKGAGWEQEGLFIARVSGDSMTPAIPDGAWCLFRQPAEQPWVGRTLLVHLPDTGGWLLKRVAAVEAPESGGWRVRLTSRNPAYSALELAIDDPSELVVAGEWLAVLA
jgi:transcriptional regulator with XRE-family HTH domain